MNFLMPIIGEDSAITPPKKSSKKIIPPFFKYLKELTPSKKHHLLYATHLCKLYQK